MMRSKLFLVCAAFVGFANGGCNSERAASRPAIAVFAASSLQESFKAIGAAFESSHPGSKVDFQFAGSSTLVMQLQQGARAGVFASADEANMEKLVSAGLASGAPKIFARNRLTIVAAPGNPKKIGGLGDLARPDLIVAICAPQVPAGAYARDALAKAKITIQPKSLESNVRGVLSKVQLGAADAGIVYHSDAVAAGAKIVEIEIADEHNAIAKYPIVAIRDSANAADAEAFVAFAQSAEARAILRSAGFLDP
jgi:molybdate transport system substrate-binding protein